MSKNDTVLKKSKTDSDEGSDNKKNKKHIITKEEIESDIKLTLKTKIKSEEKPKIVSNIDISEKTIDYKVEFQLCDWNSYHEIDDDEEEKYVIQLFGRTEDDKDVCLKVIGFTPFFYVEVPLNWTKKQADKFVEILKNKVAWCTSSNPNYDYDLSKSLVRHALVQKHKFYNFTNKKLYNFVMLVFKNHTGMREFANILTRPLKAAGLTKEPMLYQRYESNIEPHIRFMHINNLSSCGWVSIDKSKMKEDKNYSNCDHSYRVNWKDVKPSNNDDRMALFKIMGYDIECVSCDHNFPQADRKTDKIIQIGITMYRYGSMNCYEQHILTLKECAAIKDANVECYKTEKGLIRGWAKKISELRPDFKAGYNNFGFDDKYIFDRISRIDEEEANKQDISVDTLENKFIDEILQIMGKINNKYLMENEGLKKSLTYFEVKNLSSSALGDNELKFIQVPGILSVDMMKIIQRDHRLVGYKLDNVSANFITESATKFVESNDSNNEGKVKISIYTRSTKALEKNSYIQIMVDDGYSSSPLSEGAKYKVSNIETITEKKFNEKENKEETFTFQCIKTAINQKDVLELREVLLNPLLKVYWTFAKDDMHHTLINKYFKEGDPKRIKQIAKYCLKDCKLVNLLLAKLEIIVNSIGMAKVCHVPLSYLFLRGQGVKIFSLVSKKCREKNFLIPVLRRKKKDADGDEDETYEGATVITPKPGVYLSPISVLDYSSLYPNSMRERNLSQECYVNDPKYDNLPGYIYHDIYIILKDKKGKIIKNIDGTPQKEYHRFAQEIITNEQINEELKDIFDKINNDTNINIEKIKTQKYYTDDNRINKIDGAKAKLDKKIKEIMNDKDLSEKEKKKLVDNEREKSNFSIKDFVDQNEKIKFEKELSEKKIKELSNDKKLLDDEKKKLVDEEKEKLKNTIKKIIEKLEVTEDDREEFVNAEKENAKKKIADEKAKKYNIVNGQTVRYGILPEILTELLNKRKETNGRLAQEKDSFIKAILNALQLAFKVTANSLYGQTGAPTSPIYFIAIAASTTAIGRERLHYAKKIVEENFPGSEVIYGDSVTGDTPLLIRDENNNINITTIGQLGDKWYPYEQFKIEDSNRREKQQSKVDYKIMTANGWSRIKRVIRHKTIKKIYRVMTNIGCIDVTEDHSLLDKNHNKLKPKDCNIGTEILHHSIDFVNNANFDKTCAYKMGEHKKLVGFDGTKIINGTIETKKSFLEGYFLNKNIPENFLVDVNKITGICDKVDVQIMYYLLKSIGKNVRIELVNDQYLFVIDNDIKNPEAIKSIEYLRNTYDNEYVYDLETEDGTFHAGIGEIIVKNTDSIFINFHIRDEYGNEMTGKEALIKSIELAQQAAKLINDSVPKPQGIVYEKTMHPFILVAKKKYVGLLFEKDPNKYYLKSMGIVLKRRDNAPIVKIVVGGIIDHILKNRDIDGAVEYTKQVIRKLMDGKYPIDKFIISKTLKSRYKKPSTIAHKVLADRMATRDPGNKPQINDRIPFVYVVKDMGKKKKKDILQGDLIEHPDFVTKNGLKIDYLYYLEHQIINPALQILELMLPTKKVDKLFRKFIIEEENKRKGRQSMEKWMDFSTIKTKGSKTAKIPTKSLKKPDPPKRDNKYENLQFIGKTKKHECQNMKKWLATKTTNSDDWEPEFD
jgi:DNA polymerase elongation subunit (family B)